RVVDLARFERELAKDDRLLEPRQPLDGDRTEARLRAGPALENHDDLIGSAARPTGGIDRRVGVAAVPQPVKDPLAARGDEIEVPRLAHLDRKVLEERLNVD